MYENGKKEVLIPTGGGSEGWQVTKGHLRESSLFSGEYIDLGVMSLLDGWDTRSKWSEISSSDNKEKWTKPTLYESDTTLELWRYQLHVKATARKRDDRPSIPENKVAPIGKLIPHESPPVLPMKRIYPDEIYSLGDGRWMIDFGVGFSGMVRFDEGLPDPIVPDKYPRGHSVSTLSDDEAFITVIYGERLELTTGGKVIVIYSTLSYPSNRHIVGFLPQHCFAYKLPCHLRYQSAVGGRHGTP